jgi:hypothetical protein
MLGTILENCLPCGIEVQEAQNISGVPLTPDDWEESRKMATE